eukprot:3116563-Rhodomonas_salina.1
MLAAAQTMSGPDTTQQLLGMGGLPEEEEGDGEEDREGERHRSELIAQRHVSTRYGWHDTAPSVLA